MAILTKSFFCVVVNMPHTDFPDVRGSVDIRRHPLELEVAVRDSDPGAPVGRPRDVRRGPLHWVGVPVHVDRPRRALLHEPRAVPVLEVALVDVERVVLKDGILHRLGRRKENVGDVNVAL